MFYTLAMILIYQINNGRNVEYQ